MIISKTPLRISFFGGGTDYPDYFKQHGGAVLSSSIDKYIFITVNKISPINDSKYKLTYSKLEKCDSIEEIAHPSIKACLQFLDINEGLEIHVVSELPAKTGLGSSSSFTVGLLNALYVFKGQMVSKTRLADEAIYVEQQLIGEKVGNQDQAAAAFGGFNRIDFHHDGTLTATPVILQAERKEQLNNNLLLFYTGVTRYAEEVLKEQVEKTKQGSIAKDLSAIRSMVDEGLDLLSSGRDLKEFGALLNRAWLSKRSLSSGISNDYLNEMYEKAINAGAGGGKLLGAGGGGFFMFYVEPEKQLSVRTALKDYLEVAFNMQNDGSSIIFIH